MPESTVQVTLPEMGESVTEGTVSKWLKQVGEPVRQGEGLVEVTTDKVDAEIPAPANGTLSKILADAGKTIAVGAPLAEIQVGADGGGAQKREQVKTAPHPGPPPQGEGDRKVASPAAEGEGNRNLAAAPAEAEAKVAKKAAPNVSEGAELLARARGIDLAAVTGTGPEGLIRRRDVLNAIEAKEKTSAPTAEKSAAPPSPTGGSAPPLQAQTSTGSIPLRGAAGAMV
ncbi:MAG: pyruvate dehydrogenase complex dihydrolipoyllysine-residue acetyltransferase, partial [Chloroflexi bacterium]